MKRKKKKEKKTLIRISGYVRIAAIAFAAAPRTKACPGESLGRRVAFELRF